METAYARTAEEVREASGCDPCSSCPPVGNLKPFPLPCSPQVLGHYSSDPQRGLSAAQVAEARRLHGRNELAPEPGAPRCCLPPCYCIISYGLLPQLY